MLIKKVLGVGALASVPEIVDFATRFGRTIILARLLSAGELGVCVAIGVVLTIGYLVTDIGLDKFVISYPPGDDREVLSAAHQLQVARASLLAVIIFGLAPWIAQVLNAPAHATTFQWCGAIVLIHGFAHLEIAQVRRDFRYAPEAIAKLLARVVAFLAVYPAARIFQDSRAMVLSLVLDALVYVLASHVLARTSYSIFTRHRRISREAITYGLPLTLNGMGIAANSQFDRGLVSYWLGLETLALYAVLLNLAIIPISLIGAILGPLGLSFLMRAADDGGPSSPSYYALVWVYAIVSTTYAVFVAATLDLLVPLIFGQKYAVPPLLHALVTMIAWARLNRGAPTGLMLVHADTARLMAANLIASCGLILSVALLAIAPNLATVLTCLLLGDALSLALFFWWARRWTLFQKHEVGIDLCWSMFAALLASLAVFVFPSHNVWWRFAAVSAPILVLGAHIILRSRRHLARIGVYLGWSA
jgi:O-antigen/teichoic acid export membrane protein